MIRSWQVVKPSKGHSPSGPIGDPFAANKNYMAAFVVLERMAFMRLTDSELCEWTERRIFSVWYDAKQEQERRRRL